MGVPTALALQIAADLLDYHIGVSRWQQFERELTYLKIKGTFVYDRNVTPTYLWFNGNNSYRYILGDQLGKDGVTYINKPAGDISDGGSKIAPFKLHVARQPYDVVNNYLLQPVTSGEGEAVSVAPGPLSVSGFAVTWRTLPGSTTCVPSHSPRARRSSWSSTPRQPMTPPRPG